MTDIFRAIWPARRFVGHAWPANPFDGHFPSNLAGKTVCRPRMAGKIPFRSFSEQFGRQDGLSATHGRQIPLTDIFRKIWPTNETLARESDAPSRRRDAPSQPFSQWLMLRQWFLGQFGRQRFERLAESVRPLADGEQLAR